MTNVAVHAARAPDIRREATGSLPVSPVLVAAELLLVKLIRVEHGRGVRQDAYDLRDVAFQYPLMPSLLPMAMNAGMRPPDAAALAAAVCWLALEICMMIFRRSSGAVHVLASAPAVPPARKSATPVPMTCVMTATGLRCMSRATVSLGVSSEWRSQPPVGGNARDGIGHHRTGQGRELGVVEERDGRAGFGGRAERGALAHAAGDASLRPLTIIPRMFPSFAFRTSFGTFPFR